jgi:integrase
VRGSVVKRGQGRYSIVYRAPDPATGVVKQVWRGGFASKRSAETALKAIVATVDDGSYTKPTKLTLAAFLSEQWFPSIAATVAPTTLSMYRTYADAHIIPTIGGTQLRALAPPQLNALYAALLDHGRRDGKGGLSPRSVRLVHVVLHRALQDAVKWGLVSRNVASLADPPSDAPTERDVLTPGQVGAFLEHIATDRLAGLWRLLATTGLRRGEALGLRWRDVDLEDSSSLTVAQTLVVVDHRPVITPGRAKTKGSRRTLSLDPGTAAALRKHRARQGEERLAWGPAYADTDLCFTREDGTVLDPVWLTRTFDRHRKAAGLPVATLHGLRHAHATGLLQAGVPLKTVSARLGHASANVTLGIYAHVLPGDDAEAALVGARLLSGTGNER